MRLASKLIMCAVLAALPVTAGVAQDASFFKGKTIRILLSAGVSGGYAEYARVLAQHLGDHLAGKPDFIVQSMPGAGGLLATNYLYSQAPQDGTTMGIIHSTVPLAPLFGTVGARFEPLKFNWLGSLDRADGMCTVWHTSPVKTWADMLQRELLVGSTGAGSQFSILPAMLNKLFGTRIKVINGYKDGGEIFQAMEKGEIDLRVSGYARHHGIRQGCGDPPADGAHALDPGHGSSGAAAARRARRARQRDARGARGDHGGPGLRDPGPQHAPAP
jgi:tripartite-type tricarboxylate transporter receptor subunit TctC